ncbi:VOC family protein [Kribbella sp. NPDC056951]|uniref:VOC family protein n=1 Tax=Kribbella sp. NPDC056951 TaxID=3345978 RepID=UPI003645EC4D
MTVARFKDLCIDTNASSPMVAFWADVLGLTVPADNPTVLLGDTPEKTIWMNVVPDPRTTKNRVHLDVHTSSIDDLVAAGATVQGEHPHWTVLTDPEGGEFCGFVRERVPAYRLMELVVDSVDAKAQAEWWAGVVGGDLGSSPDNPWYWLENVPGLPFTYWVFVPVPEPKTAKNRVHWDVSAPALQPVLDAGATLLRPRDNEIGWHICADPEGNEFCVFLDH